MQKRTKISMGMPITVSLPDWASVHFKHVFDMFKEVDTVFSTYKENSEISRFNRLEIEQKNCSKDVVEVIKLCKKYKRITSGYFDAYNGKIFDPSGLVKGWAIKKVQQYLLDNNVNNFCIDAGGDIVCNGNNETGESWRIGIRMPKDYVAYAKVLGLENKCIATSGTYIRGQHIYNPNGEIENCASVSVVGEDILVADIFATALFAMGVDKGMNFISTFAGYDAYVMINETEAIMTPGFNKYVL